MEKIVGFLTTDEMYDSASKIGDVTTPEGKERMLEFLTKGLKTIEEDELAREAFVDSFFIKYMTRCQVDGSYYFEDGRVKPGFDTGDSIIGNAIEHFDYFLDAGNLVMNYYQEHTGCEYRDYSPEEKEALHSSCLAYNNKKQTK